MPLQSWIADYQALLAERRKHSRFQVSLPMEYRGKNHSTMWGGLTGDISEKGLLLLCSQNMAIGTVLKMTVLFTVGYELTSFDVDASVVWKDLQTKAQFRGFKYGVKFIRMAEREKLKLRYFLSAHMSVCLSSTP